MTEPAAARPDAAPSGGGLLTAAFGLAIVALLAFLPQASRADFRGTEGRRVEIAREMAVSGDWLVPTLAGEPTFAKPPLFYWCVAALYEQFGIDRFAMRFPSILVPWLFAVGAWFVLSRMYGRLAGWIAGVGVLTAPVVIYHASTVEIDPMFAGWTAGSLLAIAYGVANARSGPLVVAGVLGGLAFLTKGPPYFVFLAGGLLVWWRHRRLRGFVWFALPLVVVSVSYYVVLLGWKVSFAELKQIAARESVGRVSEYEWEHVRDLPMHFVRALGIMLPLGLWTLAEFRGRKDGRLEDTDLALRFCSGAAVGAVLILALFPGRSVRYLLPAALLFTCAVAPAVAGFCRMQLPLRSGHVAITRGFGIVGALCLVVLPFLPFPLPGRSPVLALGLAVTPLWVTTRSRLVAFALAAPVVAAWTALPDRAERHERGIRSYEHVGELLVDSMRRHGVTEVESVGHMTNSVLFDWPTVVPGDEFMVGSPTRRWVLVEESDELDELPTEYFERELSGYRDVVRVRARRKTFVLKQRRDS